MPYHSNFPTESGEFDFIYICVEYGWDGMEMEMEMREVWYSFKARHVAGGRGRGKRGIEDGHASI